MTVDDLKSVDSFRKSLAFVLKWEGGYSNDPKDPGGETNFGISKRSHPTVDIKHLTPQKAMEIYAEEYWCKTGCDAIPFPLCAVVFDTAVNMGIGRAVGWLRAAKTVQEYLQMRRMYYHNLVVARPSMGVFLKGWLNRLGDLTKLVDIAVQNQSSKWGSLG